MAPSTSRNVKGVATSKCRRAYAIACYTARRQFFIVVAICEAGDRGHAGPING